MLLLIHFNKLCNIPEYYSFAASHQLIPEKSPCQQISLQDSQLSEGIDPLFHMQGTQNKSELNANS